MATPINEDGNFIDVAAAKTEIDDYIQHLRDEGKDPNQMALGHIKKKSTKSTKSRPKSKTRSAKRRPAQV
ncbi:MAG: hypothetical protein AAGC88_06065, partial [Bacteroidota bacterium]